jgi:hypothetical protein
MAQESYLILPIIMLLFVNVLGTIISGVPSNTGIFNTNTGGVLSVGGLFSITITEGIIAVVIAVSAIFVVAGIQIFSSGLGEVATMIGFKCTFFGSIYLIFSSFSASYINSIPIIGWIIYLVITGFYGVGVMSQIGGMK